MKDAKAMLIITCLLAAGWVLPAQAVTGSVNLEMVQIEPGTFTMGADLSPGHITNKRGIFLQDELPARKVTITYKFE